MSKKPTGSYELSVVIPVWGRDEVLCKCIDSLVVAMEEAAIEGVTSEIVISSFRPTSALFSLVERLSDIKLILVDRVDWNVAAMRNAGMDAAIGDIIILLDADMLVGRRFLIEHYYAHHSFPVLCVGAVNNYQDDMFDPIDLHIGSARKNITVGQCSDDIRWSFDLTSLPLPWALAWSGNISFRKCNSSERFDCGMKGWGGEDLDWARRTLKNIGRIDFNEKVATWHQSHNRDRSLQVAEEKRNLEFFFRKDVCVETEVIATLGDIHGNIVLRDMLVSASADFIVGRIGRVGYFGIRKANFDESYMLLGLKTPWEDGELSKVIVNKHIFSFPEYISGLILSEAKRIAISVDVLN